MSCQLTDVARRWDQLGSRDPLWAALTYPSRSDRRWEAAEFLRTGRHEVDAVLALLTRRGAQPVLGTALDFGCGPGRLTAGLVAAGFSRAIGIDVSPTMLAKARELVPDPRCEFVHNEGPRLSGIPDGSVDLVYSCRVLQHIPTALAHGYVREFYRVAAPGAVAVFQLPSDPVPGVVGAVLALVPARVLSGLRRGMQMHGTPTAEVTRLVADAGGVTVSVEQDTSAGPRWQSHLYITRAAGCPGGAPNPWP